MKIVQPYGYNIGDTTLLIGSEKAAIIDTGMEYCSPRLVEEIKSELGERPLDYILLSHSHYDHVCGIPALRKAWPEVKVCAHPHAAVILAKESVRDFLMRMSKKNYEEADPDHDVVGYPLSDYKVDVELTEGMKIDLGDMVFRVVETPGHTKCCISFYDEINQILFASESTGIINISDPYSVEPTFVSSYVQALASGRKLRPLPVKMILQSHRVMGTLIEPEHYFERMECYYHLTRDIVLSMHKDGLDFERILRIYADIFAGRAEGQPYFAFMVNAKAAVGTLIREYEEGLIS